MCAHMHKACKHTYLLGHILYSTWGKRIWYWIKKIAKLINTNNMMTKQQKQGLWLELRLFDILSTLVILVEGDRRLPFQKLLHQGIGEGATPSPGK